MGSRVRGTGGRGGPGASTSGGLDAESRAWHRRQLERAGEDVTPSWDELGKLASDLKSRKTYQAPGSRRGAPRAPKKPPVPRTSRKAAGKKKKATAAEAERAGSAPAEWVTASWADGPPMDSVGSPRLGLPGRLASKLTSHLWGGGGASPEAQLEEEYRAAMREVSPSPSARGTPETDKENLSVDGLPEGVEALQVAKAPAAELSESDPFLRLCVSIAQSEISKRDEALLGSMSAKPNLQRLSRRVGSAQPRSRTKAALTPPATALSKNEQWQLVRPGTAARTLPFEKRGHVTVPGARALELIDHIAEGSATSSALIQEIDEQKRLGQTLKEIWEIDGRIPRELKQLKAKVQRLNRYLIDCNVTEHCCELIGRKFLNMNGGLRSCFFTLLDVLDFNALADFLTLQSNVAKSLGSARKMRRSSQEVNVLRIKEVSLTSM